MSTSRWKKEREKKKLNNENRPVYWEVYLSYCILMPWVRVHIYVYAMCDEFYSLSIFFDLYRSVLLCLIVSTQSLVFIKREKEQSNQIKILIQLHRLQASSTVARASSALVLTTQWRTVSRTLRTLKILLLIIITIICKM